MSSFKQWLFRMTSHFLLVFFLFCSVSLLLSFSDSLCILHIDLYSEALFANVHFRSMDTLFSRFIVSLVVKKHCGLLQSQLFMFSLPLFPLLVGSQSAFYLIPGSQLHWEVRMLQVNNSLQYTWKAEYYCVWLLQQNSLSRNFSSFCSVLFSNLFRKVAKMNNELLISCTYTHLFLTFYHDWTTSAIIYKEWKSLWKEFNFGAVSIMDCL